MQSRLESHILSLDSYREKFTEKYGKIEPRIKIFISYYQIVGPLPFMFALKFPPIYSTFVGFFGSLVSFDFIGLMPLGCLVEISHHSNLVLFTIVPILITLCLFSIYIKLSKRTEPSVIDSRNKIFGLIIGECRG